MLWSDWSVWVTELTKKAHIFWVKSAMIWPGWDGIEGADMGTMGAYLQDQFVARTS